MEWESCVRLPESLSPMVRQYLETAEWSAGLEDEGRESLQNASWPEWEATTIKRAEIDCADFLSYCAGQGIQTSGIDDEMLGNDFWLTRNRHGAGFWDGDYPEPLGRQLTDAAHTFSECAVEYDAENERLSLI